MSRGEHTDPRPTVLSCFSGAGGLDLGLEAAGFRPVGLIEFEATARRTLALNKPSWNLITPADIVIAGKQLRPSYLGLRARELDLLAGGPPCQPFSKAAQWAAGARRGMEDPRGQAVLGMLDLVESFRPKAIVIENVAGFLAGEVSAADQINARLAVINARYKTKYKLTWFVVDAADYGVPQHRRRVLATAFRNGQRLAAPPYATHAGEPVTAWDALSVVNPETTPSAEGKWAALLPSIPEGSNYLHLTARGGGDEVFGYRTRYWSFLLKLARDRPSWTLPASPGPGTGPFHWDNRPLAVEERLALQGFPAGWALAGNVREQVRLAGNATPPPLGEAVGRQILTVLRGDSALDTKELSLATPRGNAPPAPATPSAVPPQFASLIGHKPEHPGEGEGPGAKRQKSPQQLIA